jgi:signal transduction histidine kinase
VRAAVVDLREVAHGLFPTVLADEGLAPAIDVLSEQTPRLVVERLPDRRLPDAVESAAYFATWPCSSTRSGASSRASA